jgi:hypothetical protein
MKARIEHPTVSSPSDSSLFKAALAIAEEQRAQEKSGAFGTGSWTHTITPRWAPQSNLRLLYGNHQEISDLRIARTKRISVNPEIEFLESSPGCGSFAENHGHNNRMG